jgi:hypothetical protein
MIIYIFIKYINKLSHIYMNKALQTCIGEKINLGEVANLEVTYEG